MSGPPDQRLHEEQSATGKLLTGARTATEASEPGRKQRVWRKLGQPRPSRARWLIPLTVAVAATAVFLLFPRAPIPPLPDLLVAPLPVGTIALTAGEVKSLTPTGWVAAQVPQQLVDGASLRTGAHGRGWTRLSGAGALLLEDSEVRFTSGRELELLKGTLVIASDSPARIAVSASGYRIEATDAVFTVRIAAAHVELAPDVFVDEGTVTVRGPSSSEVRLTKSKTEAWPYRVPTSSPPREVALAKALFQGKSTGAEEPLTIEGVDDAELSLDGLALGFAPVKLLARPGKHSISAGPNVSADVEVKAGAAGQVSLVEPASWETARRLTLEGRYSEAVAIYEQLSSGQSARAETALYELGRIRQRFLKDPGGALTAFTAYAQRFPDGALAPEAALSAIEVQLQLGRFPGALTAMDSFLARWPASERLNDVRFLQARVHAERGDCAVALPLFVGLLDDAGHGDDALYLTAYCEQALNKQAAARGHLQQYLDLFPGGKHRAEAKAALRKR